MFEPGAVGMAVALAPTLAVLGLLVSLTELLPLTTTAWGWPLPVVIDARSGHPDLIDRDDTLRLGSFVLNTVLWALLLLYIRGVRGLVTDRLKPRQLTAAAALAPVPVLWLVATVGYNVIETRGEPVEWLLITALGSYGGTILLGIPLARFFRTATWPRRFAILGVGVTVGGGVALAALPGFGLLGCVIGAFGAAHFLQLAKMDLRDMSGHEPRSQK